MHSLATDDICIHVLSPPDDLLTLYFTKMTNSPDVSSPAAIAALLSVTPWLATGTQARWLPGGDDAFAFAGQRLVLVMAGSVNTNTTTTAVSALSVTLLSSGGLTDRGGRSQVALIGNMP